MLASIIPSLLTGCVTQKPNIKSKIGNAIDVDTEFKNLYFLAFDHEGRFTNPQEAARAIREIKADVKIKNIVILSLGWNHDRDDLPRTYQDLLRAYYGYITNKYPKSLETMKETAFFAISWESSLTGVSDAFADIIPTVMAKNIGTVLSVPFQPLTVWSKSRAADKVGLEDLKEVMTEIMNQITTPQKDFSVFMIGHSFGSRILTALSSSKLGGIFFEKLRVDDDNNKLLKSTKGMVLIQPALSPEDILSINGFSKYPENNFPIVITESRHDHLNRFGFPIIQIPFNLSSIRFSDRLRNSLNDLIPKEWQYSDTKTTVNYDWYNVVSNLVFAPFYSTASYLHGQYDELTNRNWAYIPDTLAQLPLIEIPVEEINKLTSPQQKSDEIWGNRHKGLFSFGSIMESASTYQSIPKEQNSKPVYDLEEILVMPEMPKGIIPIDASKEISFGLYGENLNNPLWDYTIGWFDPLGSHIDYNNPKIYDLIYCVTELNGKCNPNP